MVPEVPFAKAGGGIALLLTEFSERGFFRIDTLCGTVAVGSTDPDAPVVASGHQGGPRTGTDRGGNEEVREFPAFFREPIQVWRGNIRPERTNVRIAHVVDEDHDNVGLRCLFAIHHGIHGEHPHEGQQRHYCYTAQSLHPGLNLFRSTGMNRIKGIIHPHSLCSG